MVSPCTVPPNPSWPLVTRITPRAIVLPVPGDVPVLQVHVLYDDDVSDSVPDAESPSTDFTWSDVASEQAVGAIADTPGVDGADVPVTVVPSPGLVVVGDATGVLPELEHAAAPTAHNAATTSHLRDRFTGEILG